VSGVGNDADPCSRTAPCKTFAGAISKTAIFGEINCLDPGAYGAVTIVKSITIDCHEIFASILNASTTGINIPFDSFPAADSQKTVRLRNLNINGANTGLRGIRITGAAAASTNSEVFIEDCLIDGQFGVPGAGIIDERVNGELSISNTSVRNNGGTGIVVIGGNVNATLDNVRVQNSNFGVAIGASTKLKINRSVFSGNTSAGIHGEGTSQMQVNNSVSSNNGTGVNAAVATATIRLNNNDIAFNATGITGATQSFRNNRVVGNTAAGTVPTVIGAASNPSGMQ
jgi:hypothetical protein